MTKQRIEYWVIPPECDAEFVAHMENVLETYEKPYNPSQPVICMDEQPVQLIKETRQPIPATKDHPERVDYEYERNGTASIFMFCDATARHCSWPQSAPGLQNNCSNGETGERKRISGSLKIRLPNSPNEASICPSISFRNPFRNLADFVTLPLFRLGTLPIACMFACATGPGGTP